METESRSKFCGIVLTAAFHAILSVICVSSGLKYIYPPPREKSIVMEFVQEDEPVPVERKVGREPRSASPKPDKKVELVQKSEAPLKGSKANQAQESTVGPDGDVEVPEPPRKKEINRRALFSAADNNSNKDTLAAQTASRVSDALKAGNPEGNTRTGKTDGEPSAKLEGRDVMGSLPLPQYTVQDAGKIVVRITVDRQGRVTSATPGAQGTTVMNRKMWEAAKQAALKANFNQSSSAPESQSGTITYIFKLR